MAIFVQIMWSCHWFNSWTFHSFTDGIVFDSKVFRYSKECVCVPLVWVLCAGGVRAFATRSTCFGIQSVSVSNHFGINVNDGLCVAILCKAHTNQYFDVISFQRKFQWLKKFQIVAIIMNQHQIQYHWSFFFVSGTDTELILKLNAMSIHGQGVHQSKREMRSINNSLHIADELVELLSKSNDWWMH